MKYFSANSSVKTRGFSLHILAPFIAKDNTVCSTNSILFLLIGTNWKKFWQPERTEGLTTFLREASVFFSILLSITSRGLKNSFPLFSICSYAITLFWPKCKAPFYRFIADPDPDQKPDSNCSQQVNYVMKALGDSLLTSNRWRRVKKLSFFLLNPALASPW